jgi:hypothetical protein
VLENEFIATFVMTQVLYLNVTEEPYVFLSVFLSLYFVPSLLFSFSFQKEWNRREGKNEERDEWSHSLERLCVVAQFCQNILGKFENILFAFGNLDKFDMIEAWEFLVDVDKLYRISINYSSHYKLIKFIIIGAILKRFAVINNTTQDIFLYFAAHLLRAQ